jgi:S1-C subfamily serine protease
VKAQIRILSGACAGQVHVFSRPHIAIGRHPGVDLRFDPQHDLAVSARHAAIVRQGAHWIVRDLDSRNGVFVNGHRVTGDTRLADTDQIRFGPDGPTAEFRLVPDHVPDGPLDAGGPRAAAASTTSTTQRIRVEVGRQTRHLRLVITALLLVVVAGGVALALSGREARRTEAALAALQARSDSVRAAADQALRALRGKLEELAAALRTSQAEVARLQELLRDAQRSGDAGAVDDLRHRLAEVTDALQHQQLAAQVDYSRIVDPNQRAVAMLYAEYEPGDVVTGTAFAVRPDGTLLTNRHLVAGHGGDRRPTRVGIRFADSDQFWPARVLAVAQDADLAAVKVDIRGGVPTVRGLNTRPDTLRQGDPVALVGFPSGTELPMSAREGRTVARTTFAPGTVSKVLHDVVQVLGYGAPGASGSPIFDRKGEVVGVLYGGEPGSDGRILFAVPSNLALRLLEGIRE